MPLINKDLKNISPSLVEKLDNIPNYTQRSLITSLVDTFTSANEREVKLVEQHTTAINTVVNKYEKILNITTFKPPIPLKLSIQIFNPTFTSLIEVEKLYEEDFITAQENEIIIKNNTETLDAVVKYLEKVGLHAKVYRYPNTRSTIKKEFEAEWYKEIKETFITNFSINRHVYLPKHLSEIYEKIKKQYNEHFIKEKEVEVLKAKETENLLAVKREAILIAHTCIKYNIDPVTVTIRSDLNARLIEMGFIPDSVLNDIAKEIF
jgi:hypothetical protein